MNMSKKEHPLVSVPVITYNSAMTVIETLESIKAQTYPNIELIISDDCSMDNTVELCREWLEKNNGRFIRTEILTVEKNTGVAQNCNRAETACQAEWVKGIAGDDLLMPNCISEFMNYVGKHPEATHVFSRVEVFGDNEEKVQRMSRFFKYEFFTDWTLEQQLGYLLAVDNCIPAMALFYNAKRSKELKIINDTRVPNLEDHPKWINYLRAGVHFDFVDMSLVRYRLSDSSLCTGTKYRETFSKSLAARYIYYLYPTNKAIMGRKVAYYKYISSKAVLSKCTLFWKVLRRLYKLMFL